MTNQRLNGWNPQKTVYTYAKDRKFETGLRKAALYALIEEIVVYPDALIEVKYRIRNRYRTASKAVEDGQYPRVCTATAVHTLRRIIFPRKRIGAKTA